MDALAEFNASGLKNVVIAATLFFLISAGVVGSTLVTFQKSWKEFMESGDINSMVVQCLAAVGILMFIHWMVSS